MSNGHVINELFAFVAVHEDGDEGIVGSLNPADGTWMPFIGSDKDRIDSLRPLARKIAQQTGQDIRLLHFTTRTELEFIKSGD